MFCRGEEENGDAGGEMGVGGGAFGLSVLIAAIEAGVADSKTAFGETVEVGREDSVSVSESEERSSSQESATSVVALEVMVLGFEGLEARFTAVGVESVIESLVRVASSVSVRPVLLVEVDRGGRVRLWYLELPRAYLR